MLVAVVYQFSLCNVLQLCVIIAISDWISYENESQTVLPCNINSSQIEQF